MRKLSGIAPATVLSKGFMDTNRHPVIDDRTMRIVERKLGPYIAVKINDVLRNDKDKAERASNTESERKIRDYAKQGDADELIEFIKQL